MHSWGWEKRKHTPKSNLSVGQGFCKAIAHLLKFEDNKVIFLTLWPENGEKDLGWYLRNTWTDHHSHPLLGIPLWGCMVLFQRHPQSRGFPHTGHKLLLSVSESECKSREILENPNAKQEKFTSVKTMLPLYCYKEMRHSLFFSENNHTWYYHNMVTLSS